MVRGWGAPIGVLQVFFFVRTVNFTITPAGTLSSKPVPKLKRIKCVVTLL